MTIEREYDKEMGADRGPLLNELERIERVHKMTTRDESGVPVMPWFAGVKSGTYVRFVPKAIVDAKPWCSHCGQPLAIESGPAWGEPVFMCKAGRCGGDFHLLLRERDSAIGDLRWADVVNKCLPRAPWWKRALARVKECF